MTASIKAVHTQPREGLGEVTPFRVMSVMQRAAELETEGRSIVHLEVGEPDFSTAQPIVDAGKAALDAGLTQYTAATGLTALRGKISARYKSLHGIDVDPKRILVTPGASGGLLLLAHLLVGRDEGVLIPDPAYPCVRNFIRLRDAQAQLVPVQRENNYQPSVTQLIEHRTPSSCGIWLASPNNPTGTVLDRAALQEISVFARSEGLHLLVDEIYHGLDYVGGLPSVLEVDDSAFVVNSFSKYFGMTGWRLGWIVVPDAFVETATTLAQNMYISASAVAQYAALAAFESDTDRILAQRRDEFRARRDYLVRELETLGFVLPKEIAGAFYVYADCSAFTDDSEAFCRKLLEEHGVAMTPGTDFGEASAQQSVRLSFTTSQAQLELAVSRLREALR